MSKGSRSGTMRKSASKRSFLSSDGSLGSNKAAHSGDILEAWEELFKHQMASIASILLKSSVVATAHDTDLLRTYVDKRAQEYVEEGLASLLPLDSLASSASSSSYQSRLTAYAQLSSDLIAELESVAMNGVHRQQVISLREVNHSLRGEISKSQSELSQRVASREMQIEELQSEKAVLEAKNAALLKTVEILERTLERSTRSISDLHQSSVELCMQGLDLKAEVDYCCDKLAASITGKLGFIPSKMQQHLTQLRLLQVPGQVVPNPDGGKAKRKANKQLLQTSADGNSSKSSLGTPSYSKSAGSSPSLPLTRRISYEAKVASDVTDSLLLSKGYKSLLCTDDGNGEFSSLSHPNELPPDH